MSDGDLALQLTPAQEERALRLYRESTVFITHDHDLLEPDIAAMQRSGVTAKQVHISLDGQIWADRQTYWASASPEELARERTRVGASGDAAAPPRDGQGLGVFLRSALVAMDYVYWQVEKSGGRVALALEPEDIRDAKRRGAVALLLGSEGSRLLDDRLEVLRMLYRMGLRHLQLSWAWRTSVGAPQSDSSGRGLTDFGRDLVRELNRLGIIVDVAHLSYRSIEDVLAVSEAPVLCSHTGAAALNPEQTVLLPDELLRAIADLGGVIGLHFMSQVVKPGRHKASFAELMQQFTYVSRLVGPEHISCSPDYLYLAPRTWENAGITVPFVFADGVEDITRMPNVARGLVAHGFSDDEIRGILGENLLRFWEAVRSRAQRGPWTYTPAAEGLGACTAGTTPL